MKAIIEIPKWSKSKTEIKATGDIAVLYKTNKRFIANYGRLPGTLAGDGDCADVFVLGKRLKTGTELEVAAITLVKFIHREKEDNKVVAYTGKLTYMKKLQLRKLVAFLNAQEGTTGYASADSATKYAALTAEKAKSPKSVEETLM